MTIDDDAELRKLARKRLEAKQGFWWFLVVYIVVSLFLVGIWFFNGAGYFWPAWAIGGMTIALVFTGVAAFTSFGGPITPAKIDAEMRRLRGE